MTEGEVERVLRDAAFPNPSHKAALRAKLFADREELALDDLAMVAGGVQMEEAPVDIDAMIAEIKAKGLSKEIAKLVVAEAVRSAKGKPVGGMTDDGSIAQYIDRQWDAIVRG